ncbi:hypothetical protein ACWERV_34960 [Streptomyces sp. NPDC004031]
MAYGGRRQRAGAMRVAALAVVLGVGLAACGSGAGGGSSVPGTHHHAMPSASMPAGMPGMDGTADSGGGLSDASGGYRMTSATAEGMPGMAMPYRFTITGPEGRAVTSFAVEQTKRLHFYAIRSDLTGFQHLHPAMAADGTWTAALPALAPGAWRLFATFTPSAGEQGLVLSRTLTVPGAAHATPLPRPAASAEADGYTVSVRADLTAGKAGPLTVAVARSGAPVTDLEPYLGTYAHLTAFHAGDQALAHLHPESAVPAGGGKGGPELAFHAELPEPGEWRLFLQFRAGGALHTAALTLHVAG